MPELVLGPIDDYDYAESIPWFDATTSSNGGASNLYIVECAKRRAPFKIGVVRCYPAVQSGNLDVGVWTFDGTTWTLLGSSGSTAVGTANTMQAVSLAAAVTVPPATRFYLGLVTDNGTATFQRAATPNTDLAFLHPSVAKKASTSIPLSTNAASFVIGALVTAVYAPWLRASLA